MYWENASWQVPARALEVLPGAWSVGSQLHDCPPSPVAGCLLQGVTAVAPQASLPTEPGRAPVPGLNQTASSPRAGAEQPLSSTGLAHSRFSGAWAESTSAPGVLASPQWDLRADPLSTGQGQLRPPLVPTVPYTGLGHRKGSRSMPSIHRDRMADPHTSGAHSHAPPGVGPPSHSDWLETGRVSAVPWGPGSNWLKDTGHCHFWPGLVAVPVWPPSRPLCLPPAGRQLPP